MGNHLFVIFSLLDVSFAVNSFLNCSFLKIYLKPKEHSKGQTYVLLFSSVNTGAIRY